MKKTCFVLVIFFLMILTGCKHKENKENSILNENKESSILKETPYYISFTVTHEGDSGEFISDVYYYDINLEKLTSVASLPYTSQYPLCVYNKEDHSVFFSTKKDKGDQLARFDLETKKTEVLTDDIYAINYIIPIKEQVFFGEVPLHAPILAVRPFVWNKDNHNFSDLTYDTDLHFEQLSYDFESDVLVGAAFSASEDQKRIAEQIEIPYKNCENIVYQIIDKEYIELFREEENIVSLFSQNKNIIYKTKDSSFKKFDYETKIISDYSLPSKIENIKEIIYISPTNDIYYLHYNLGTALMKYSSTDDTISIIYQSNIEVEELNNAIVLKSN